MCLHGSEGPTHGDLLHQESSPRAPLAGCEGGRSHGRAELRFPLGPLQSLVPLRPTCLGAGHMTAGRWANVLAGGSRLQTIGEASCSRLLSGFGEACAALHVTSFFYLMVTKEIGRRYCNLASQQYSGCPVRRVSSQDVYTLYIFRFGTFLPKSRNSSHTDSKNPGDSEPRRMSWWVSCLGFRI